MYYVVTTIGERAFYRCPYLQHLTLPATIDRIENEAFVDAFLDASNSDITCLATTPPSISPYAFGSEINDLTLYVLKDCKAAYMAHNVWKNFGNIVELPYHLQEGKVFYAITGPNTVSVVHRNPSYNSYWGQVTIPSTVKHKGTTYTVADKSHHPLDRDKNWQPQLQGLSYADQHHHTRECAEHRRVRLRWLHGFTGS